MRWLTLLSVAMLIALPLWVATTFPAHACTCDPGTREEQVERAELIVVGTALEPEFIEPLPTPIPEPLPTPVPSATPSSGSEVVYRSGTLVPIVVEEYLKGAGPETLTVSGPRVEGRLGPGTEIVIGPETGPMDCFQVFGLEGGRVFLFLARLDEQVYRTSECEGSLRFTPGNESFVLARIEEVRLILQGGTPTATESATAAPEQPTPTAGPQFPPSGSGGGGGGDSSVLWPSLAGAGAAMLLGSGAVFALRRGDS